MKKKYRHHQKFADIGCAKLDISRWKEKGIPEAIFCLGKTHEQIKKIAHKMIHDSTGPVLFTRANPSIYRIVKKINTAAQWYPDGRMIVIRSQKRSTSAAPVAVITGGTADIPVAEEACVTIEAIGIEVKRLFDVGVAGMHRLVHYKEVLLRVSCAVVCAGMEGALASVVGGLVSVPVIGVPTSIGYGASFEGIAPLLTMLNTCSPNVSVVNIDNGFGAGIIATLIARKQRPALYHSRRSGTG